MSDRIDARKRARARIGGAAAVSAAFHIVCGFVRYAVARMFVFARLGGRVHVRVVFVLHKPIPKKATEFCV